jgi:hypothetical protein
MEDENMGLAPFLVVFGGAACALVGSWVYFRRYQLSRPPIGVMNIRDIATMIFAIMALPFLYLFLPVWMVATFLLLSALSVLYFTIKPALRTRWVVWVAALALLLLDGGAVYVFTAKQNTYFAVNNLALLLLVVGVANLWAQSGVKARDMVLLGIALAIYDFFATAQSLLMITLIERLSNLPLAPIIAWNGDGGTLLLGLGDVLLASVFPLVMRKAFGRAAGLVALALALVTIGILLAHPIRQGFPVMVVLGPLMAAQYLYWRWRRGGEWTTRQYLQEEPLNSAQVTHPARVLG